MAGLGALPPLGEAPLSQAQAMAGLSPGDLSEKVHQLEARARQLSKEETHELTRGKELHIIPPTPGSKSGGKR